MRSNFALQIFDNILGSIGYTILVTSLIEEKEILYLILFSSALLSCFIFIKVVRLLSCSKVNIIPKITVIPKTTTMYHVHTFGSNKCMHVIHSGGFRFGDGFEYTYLMCMWHCALSYKLQVVQKPWSLVYNRVQN